MAINEKVLDALNKQMNAELYSGYLYMAMSAYLEDKGLPGFANLEMVNAKEELDHAIKFYNYIIRRGGKVAIEAIEKPTTDWENPVAVLENVVSHEEKVTGLINDVLALSIEEKDYATSQFLQWFVDEQVEEEETANDDLNKPNLAMDSGNGLYMLDQEFAARMYTPPADNGE